MNKVLVIAKELGKGIVTKENGMNALKILSGVAIGLAVATISKRKKMKLSDGWKKIKDNRQPIIMGASIGLGLTMAIAAKNAIPRVKSALVTTTKVADALEDILE